MREHQIYLGKTLLLQTDQESVPHLWAVVAQSSCTTKVLIVNVTTFWSHSDPTVILNNGDHPFIKHKSSINYAEMREVGTALIIDKIKKGVIKIQNDLEVHILQKIQEGVSRTPRIHPVIKKIYADWASTQSNQ